MVRVSLKPSRYITAVLIAVHTAAAAVVWPLQMSEAAKVTLAAFLVASLAISLRRHALLKARGAIVQVVLKGADTVSVRTRDGSWREARILGTTYVSPVLTALNVKAEGFKLVRHIVLVPDNVDSEDFRKLRVALRWGLRDTVKDAI